MCINSLDLEHGYLLKFKTQWHLLYSIPWLFLSSADHSPIEGPAKLEQRCLAAMCSRCHDSACLSDGVKLPWYATIGHPAWHWCHDTPWLRQTPLYHLVVRWKRYRPHLSSGHQSFHPWKFFKSQPACDVSAKRNIARSEHLSFQLLQRCLLLPAGLP